MGVTFRWRVYSEEEFTDDSDDSGDGAGVFNAATDVDTHSDADSVTNMSAGEQAPQVILLNDEDKED